MPVGSQVHPYPRCPNEVSAREKAVSHALADVRQEYLAYLETWREGLSESDLIGSAVLDGQIHTLRRQLGMQAEPTATGFANWSASGPDGIASAGKQ
ncbi:MAG: hypothetical protein ABWY13_09415 [Mesorhizobium sp.]